MKYRQIFIVQFFAMVLSIAGSYLLPVSYITAYGAEEVISNAPVTMEISCGYDGSVKSGRYVPVNYKLTSNLEVPFKGVLRVTIMDSDKDTYEYDYPVSLEEKGTTEDTLNISIGTVNVLYVQLLNTQGKELIRKRIKLDSSADIAELYVGVLSDEPEKLTYMDGVGINYSSLRIKNINMKTEDIPNQAIGLNLLDVLVVTDYDTRKLSKNQITAIWEWVKEGGTLLIGTGNRADDTLYAFQSDILEEAYSAPEEKSVDMGVEYATNGPGDSFMNLVCTDVSLKGGTSVLASDEFPVLTSMTKGKGLVGVAAYDFVEIAPFCEVQHSYVDKLFTALLGDDKLNQLSSYLYSGSTGQYWSVQNMLNTGNLDKIPKLYLYIIVIFGYILLVGPGLYLFLKKREHRTFYRTGIVMISLLFTVVVYLLGIRTRFKDTFFTYATIKDTTENTIDEYTYVNMRAPSNKAYTISFKPSYDLLPITKNNFNEPGSDSKFKKNEDYTVRIYHGEKNTNISVQNVSAFTPKYFELRKKTPNMNHIGLVGKITLFEGSVSGSITNEYPFRLEKVGILMYGKLVVLDKLKPGETRKLDGLPVINYPINSSELIAARVTGAYLYPKADVEDSAYTLSLARTNVLKFYLDNFSANLNQEARIVAFGNEQLDNQFLNSGDYESHGISLFISNVSMKRENEDLLFRSVLMKSPKIVGGQYSKESNSIYGIDPVTLEYYLGNYLQVEKLTFEKPADEFLNSTSSYYTVMFKGNIYFYNHDTGNFDVMDSEKKDYLASELAPYLSPENTLTVKYVCDNINNNNWYATLPMLTVVGREK